MSDKSPAAQFYFRDFLADTAHLTNEEIGTYIRLICYAWIGINDCPQGWLPDDDEILSRLVGIKSRKWVSMGSQVKKLFKIKEDGKIGHKRLLEELQNQAKRREARQLAGKKGADSRWQRHKQSHSNAIILPMAKNSSASASASASATSFKEGEGPSVSAPPSSKIPPKKFIKILKDRGITGSNQQIESLASTLESAYSIPALAHTMERHSIVGIDVFVLERKFGNGLEIMGAKGCKKCSGSGQNKSAGYSPGAGRYPYCVCVKPRDQ